MSCSPGPSLALDFQHLSLLPALGCNRASPATPCPAQAKTWPREPSVPDPTSGSPGPGRRRGQGPTGWVGALGAAGPEEQRELLLRELETWHSCYFRPRHIPLCAARPRKTGLLCSVLFSPTARYRGSIALVSAG